MELPENILGEPGSTHAEQCGFIKVAQKHNLPAQRSEATKCYVPCANLSDFTEENIKISNVKNASISKLYSTFNFRPIFEILDAMNQKYVVYQTMKFGIF